MQFEFHIVPIKEFKYTHEMKYQMYLLPEMLLINIIDVLNLLIMNKRIKKFRLHYDYKYTLLQKC